MSDAFDAALEKATSEVASPELNTKDSTETSVEQSAKPEGESTPQKEQAVAQAIAELDKMDKFKLDGQEWTLKDLKAAIMRQQDYTKKTQAHAKDVETFQAEKQFHENLAFDLRKLEKNPSLINEFLKVYPQKFHQYAQSVLDGATPTQAQAQVQGQEQPRANQPDVQLLSRLTTLEKFYHDQEVAKNEAQIKQQMDDLAKKFPETDKKLARETILARAHELYLRQQQPLQGEQWETIAKEVADEVKDLSRAEYAEKVKQQTEANKQGRDVAAGGGTAGRAPQKFKNFDEISKAAEAYVRGGAA